MEPVWGLCWAGNGGSPPPTAASESGAESTAAQVLRRSWDTLGAGVSIWRQWGSPDDLENANPSQLRALWCLFSHTGPSQAPLQEGRGSLGHTPAPQSLSDKLGSLL